MIHMHAKSKTRIKKEILAKPLPKIGPKSDRKSAGKNLRKIYEKYPSLPCILRLKFVMILDVFCSARTALAVVLVRIHLGLSLARAWPAASLT